MANFGVEVDTGPILKALAKLGRKTTRSRAQGLIARHVIHQMEEYPAQRSISRKAAYGSTFFSDVQRKAFFAMLNSGEISVPRRRTNALGQSFYIEEKGDEVRIGNRKRYSRFVIDKNRQSRMMAMIGWNTLQDVVSRELKTMMKILREEIRKDFK